MEFLPLIVLLRARRVQMAGDEKLTSETTTNDFQLVETIDKGSFGKIMLERSEERQRGVRHEGT